MYKNIILVTLSGLIFFALGLLTGYKFAASAVPAKTQNNVLGGPVVAVTQTVTGKVVQVDGKSMTVEANGGKLTLKAAKTVAIVKPETPVGTLAGTVKPDDYSRPDFSSVPVGSQISAVLELQIDGTFLTRSVFLVPEGTGLQPTQK